MLGSFVAGAYTGTLNAASLGLTREGYRLRWAYAYDNIEQTDGYGAANLIESFLEGVAVWIGGIFMEWRAGVLAAVNPWSGLAASGSSAFDLGIVGRAATNVGGALVLTATAGTPAANSPASLTAALAIVDNGFNMEPNFGPTHRETPFMFRIYPTSIGGNTRYFSVT